MYPHSHLPAPLQPAEFYLLLALNRTEAHGYAIRAMIANLSLGSVRIPDSNIYRLIHKLADEAYIEPTGDKPTAKTGTPRTHYTITTHGTLRLKEELIRLDHALKVAQNASLMQDDTPIDIQRLILDAQT
ncbi:MAG TPA: helix-turn-helix transcriptional regulator [Candidatus Saccharimonadia bacterium]|nr:helix-turn-helix transcriptional regulator [Candidatus Saccharimonadia bacterium]